MTNLERIRYMRAGGKIPCPICKSGEWSAVGTPSEARVFRCSHCGRNIIMTVNHNLFVKD